MKVTQKTEQVLQIELTESQARLLMGMTQNPSCPPDQEPDDESQLRSELFYTLRAALYE